MTQAIPFTKAKLRRALDTARERGFRLLVKPDGTLVFENDGNPQAADKPLEQGEEIVLGWRTWATAAGIVRVDPTVGVSDPSRPKSDGFPPWSEDDVAAYYARWPIGTRERVWIDVIAYTGLRRGDAVRLGRQHIRNGVATFKTQKTGAIVTLPILPILSDTLAAGPCGDLTFIIGERGSPLTKESFGNAFKKACKAAGVSDRSAHGLRKIAATRAADRGATEAQLEAIFGWTGGRMASLYTRSANRRRLSVSAMHLLANDE
jgi:integrase